MIGSEANLPSALRAIWLVAALLFVLLATVDIAVNGRSVAAFVLMWASLATWAVATVGLWAVLFI